MNNLLAQNIKLPDGSTVTGPLDPAKFTNPASLVTKAMPIIFAVAGIILLGILIWGGFDYLTSMGDPKKAEAGKTKITNGLLGFIIIFAAYWIVQIIDYVLHLGVYTP
jgi:hypothetical protein